MRGTTPTIHCDHKDGCDNWIVDVFEEGVTNWREILRGWYFEPHLSRETAYCPKHAGNDTTKEDS